MMGGIRGHWLIRYAAGNAFAIPDLGTPESDAALVQLLREIPTMGGAYPPAQVQYSSWEVNVVGGDR